MVYNFLPKNYIRQWWLSIPLRLVVIFLMHCFSFVRSARHFEILVKKRFYNATPMRVSPREIPTREETIFLTNLIITSLWKKKIKSIWKAVGRVKSLKIYVNLFLITIFNLFVYNEIGGMEILICWKTVLSEFKINNN